MLYWTVIILSYLLPLPKMLYRLNKESKVINTFVDSTSTPIVFNKRGVAGAVLQTLL